MGLHLNKGVFSISVRGNDITWDLIRDGDLISITKDTFGSHQFLEPTTKKLYTSTETQNVENY